ncbi:MAG: hypothetical protein KKE86_03015, partial [Planctomycetes bacterium]|nr:hypothetical protein [Planctomycetota bacterium]
MANRGQFRHYIASVERISCETASGCRALLRDRQCWGGSCTAAPNTRGRQFNCRTNRGRDRRSRLCECGQQIDQRFEAILHLRMVRRTARSQLQQSSRGDGRAESLQ